MINSLARFVYHEIDKEQFAESKRQGVKHWDSALSAFSEWLISYHLMQQVEECRNIQFSGTKPFIQRIQMGGDELNLIMQVIIYMNFLKYATKLLLRETGFKF